ncbi:glycosyltransferase family 2 protein [Hymenobacter armeniacus]|uniref:Glycosyltransferase n=1 Tax=Hymenobacter armeniacus TaxID=2771358 RepID=A0ABR8JXI2_9BACT|nr:glycosyltransferase [Hymenobacter armeniacus]MBD2724671.1 glycosyltransferase [Hymenobacter armeniacus]
MPDLPGRPRWSVMIPAYNCAAFLPDALKSVLAQAPGPELMQIEVVDDASTDADVQALVEAHGHGRVGYFRQPRNVGSIRNFETCINRARGHIVHILHGDDRLMPVAPGATGFYQKMGELLDRYPEAGAAACHYAYINEAGRLNGIPARLAEEDGLLEDWLLRLAKQQQLQYACTVVRRRVYEELGSFYGNSYGEDWEMWVRIARHYPVAYTPDTLAQYRGHGQSISWTKLMSGELVTDMVQVIGRIQEHVPAAQRKAVADFSGKFYAHFVITTAYELAERSQDWGMVYRLVKKSLELHRDAAMYQKVLRAWFKYQRTKLLAR